MSAVVPTEPPPVRLPVFIMIEFIYNILIYILINIMNINYNYSNTPRIVCGALCVPVPFRPRVINNNNNNNNNNN